MGSSPPVIGQVEIEPDTDIGIARGGVKVSRGMIQRTVGSLKLSFSGRTRHWLLQWYQQLYFLFIMLLTHLDDYIFVWIKGIFVICELSLI